MFSGSSSGGQMKKKDQNGSSSCHGAANSTGNNKELHMFVWSSSASPVSEGKHAVNRAATASDFAAVDASKAQQEAIAAKGKRKNETCLG